MSLTEQLFEETNPAESEPESQTAEEIDGIDLLLKRLTAMESNKPGAGPVYEPWHKRRVMPGAKRLMFPVCGEVEDVNGIWWGVRDVRVTRHGFDLCFGNPADDYGAWRGGPPSLIATKPLWDFWDANRMKGHGFLFDLPAGRTTLKRLRSKLGFNFKDDTREFWTERIEELGLLPTREFAARHGVVAGVVSARRARMVGRRARPVGWWRTAKVRRILLAGLTLIKTGRKLGIGISTAKRLRDRARVEAQLLATPVDRKVRLADVRTLPKEDIR
jgi:hypothetical protein